MYNLDIKIKYQEGYLPTKRHRKLRYRDVEEEIQLGIREAKKDKAPIALIHHNYDGEKEEYRYFNKKLWTKLYWGDVDASKSKGELMPLSKLPNYLGKIYGGHERDEVVEHCKDELKRYLIIGDVVYKEREEPRYVIMTFGLGHNHASTSLMTCNRCNPNISRERYFNALEKERAIREAKEVAISRGDTESVKNICSYNIEVLIPEAIKFNRCH